MKKPEVKKIFDDPRRIKSLAYDEFRQYRDKVGENGDGLEGDGLIEKIIVQSHTPDAYGIQIWFAVIKNGEVVRRVNAKCVAMVEYFTEEAADE